MNRRSFAQTLASAAFAGVMPAPAVRLNAETAPPFPLSVMLWTVFTDLPFDQRLEKIAAAGYSNVELVSEYEGWTRADFDKANQARQRHGIRFDCTAGLKHGVATPGTQDALLAELKQSLEAMELLGCPAIIMLSGNVIPGVSREAQHQSAIDSLKAAVKLVEGKKIDGQTVRLLLECIDPEENPNYYLQSAAEGIEIVRAVNHPQVQFLYDLFHEQIAEGNLMEKLEKNIDVIGLIHVADVPGRHEPGTGEINYTNIFRKLAELKYRHVVAMEFHPVGDPVETLRAARIGVSRAIAG